LNRRHHDHCNAPAILLFFLVESCVFSFFTWIGKIKLTIQIFNNSTAYILLYFLNSYSYQKHIMMHDLWLSQSWWFRLRSSGLWCHVLLWQDTKTGSYCNTVCSYNPENLNSKYTHFQRKIYVILVLNCVTLVTHL